MELKTCSKCKEELPATNEFFNKDKSRKDNLTSRCRKWISKYNKEKIENNSEFRRKKIESDKRWNKENPEKVKEYQKKYYQENKESFKEKAKKWKEANPEREKENSKKWKEENKEKVKEYKKERRKNNPMVRFIQNLRTLTRIIYKQKDFRKNNKTIELLGCSPEELRNYLRSLYQPGMTEDNYGEWHIDHIIPLSSAKSKEELDELAHYTNLQPLWAEDNLRKGDSILQRSGIWLRTQ